MKNLLWIAAAVPCLAATPDPARQIRDEIVRAQRLLETRPVADQQLAGMVPRVAETLRGAASALDSGKIYLALERLGQAMDSMEGLHSAAAATAQFEQAWADANVRVGTLVRELRNTGAASPAALRAMVETAIGRTGPLLDGGRGFALSNGPKDGFYYIGQAAGQAEFARFAAGLKIERTGRAWRARSMLPELVALQERTNAAFRPPKSIEQHSRFIALNSAIKLARELDAAKSYHGAFYQYLEAVRHFAMLDQPALDAATQDRARQELKAAAGRFGRAQDDSIAGLLVERALAWAEHGEADEWRGAQVIASRVLPAYYAVLKGAPSAPRSNGKTVEVTLVRWPYT